MARAFGELKDPLWEMLSSVKRPSRYAGGEWGADGGRNRGAERVSLCLAFPDVYEVGMSYLGFQVLYDLASKAPGVRVERAYCPWPDAEFFMREKGMVLRSLETEKPLSSFDVVGFTLQYELAATNILTMLDLGGIPLRAPEGVRILPWSWRAGPGPSRRSRWRPFSTPSAWATENSFCRTCFPFSRGRGAPGKSSWKNCRRSMVSTSLPSTEAGPSGAGC